MGFIFETLYNKWQQDEGDKTSAALKTNVWITSAVHTETITFLSKWSRGAEPRQVAPLCGTLAIDI